MPLSDQDRRTFRAGAEAAGRKARFAERLVVGAMVVTFVSGVGFAVLYGLVWLILEPSGSSASDALVAYLSVLLNLAMYNWFLAGFAALYALWQTLVGRVFEGALGLDKRSESEG
jgi:uncharacterized RDD family membrane protein YckC